VPALALFERRRYVDLDEITTKAAHELTRFSIRGDEGCHHSHAVRLQPAGQESGSPYVLVSFLSGEAGHRKDTTNGISIEVFDLGAVALERLVHVRRDCALSRAGKAGEPENGRCERHTSFTRHATRPDREDRSRSSDSANPACCT